MTAPIHDPWHSHDEPCEACDLRIERHLAEIAATPDPAATAEQTVADLLALLAVYEAKPIAYQWIRPSVIRSIIESGGAE